METYTDTRTHTQIHIDIGKEAEGKGCLAMRV